MNAEPILFIAFGALTLIGAVAVIGFKNPVYSAIALIVTFFAQAGLFILLGAHFVAAVQVIVYAGAIMVLFLFVIMLLNLGSVHADRPKAGIAKGAAIVLGIIFALEGVYIAVNAYKGTAVARVKQESDVGEGAITTAQLEEISKIQTTYQLTRDEINTEYVPKVATADKALESLTAVEAQKLIQTLRGEMGKTERIGSVLFSKFLLPFEVTSLILLAALIGVIALVKREQPKGAS
jgi:NADH-quinone oxidoreductase subunit J